MEKIINMTEEEQVLIPGLPEDVALDCISRVPHGSHSHIRPVCKKWRDLVTSPSFSRHRERIGAAEDLVFLVQARKDESKSSADKSVAAGELKARSPPPPPPVYSLNLYNATLATWQRIESPEAIPMFSQCAIADRQLVLVGGWDPKTLDPVAETRILDLATMTWRRGRPMAAARSFFACAAFGGKVYVAGGHDGSKNALRSAEVYDVAADEWASLPPMSEERDEARGVVLGGKFMAVSGYGTESQGRFATSAEAYDEGEGAWTTVEGAWDDATCASCFGLGDAMWSVGPKEAREFRDGEWRAVGPAAEGMRPGSGTCGAVTGEGERVFVAGGEGIGVMDVRSRKWVRVEAGAGFNGFVYSAAAVRI